MNISVSVLCSVLISAGLTLALLMLVRSGLARQFAEIERRLGQVEQGVHAIKAGQESAAVAEQLKRLHKGLVRVQENMAERYGPLVPLADELRANVTEQRRFLGDYAVSRLERWSAEIGAPVGRNRILKLAAEIASLDVEAEVPDFEALLAALIAIQRWRNGRLSVALPEAAPAWLRRLLMRSEAVGAMEVISPGMAADVFFVPSGQSPAGADGKGFVSLESMPMEVLPSGLRFLASFPGVDVYQNVEAS